jgi:hypothetical protein
MQQGSNLPQRDRTHTFAWDSWQLIELPSNYIRCSLKVRLLEVQAPKVAANVVRCADTTR